MIRKVSVGSALLLLLGMAVPAGAANGGKQAPPEPPPAMNADLDANGIFDNLEEAIKNAGAGEKRNVIVQLKAPANQQALAAIERHMGTLKVNQVWDAAVHGFATSLTPGQIRAMARAPQVRSVELDMPVQAFLGTANQWMGVAQARADYGLDGDRDGNPTSYSKNDVVVAIIDTGIDAAHVDLDGGKVIGFRDEINGSTSAYDDQGHGTHVASIVAGTGDGDANYKGVAPGAALVGIKVLNSQGSGTMTDIIDGINWMISNKATYNIQAANMSLGSTGCSDGTDSLSVAVNNASNSGIAMFVAAGNSGPSTCTVGAPAAAAQAITIGAGIDPGEQGWALADFSSRGPTADNRLKPDIVTPGFSIMAAKMGSGSAYVAYSGTSMATPYAAGVGALMLDANPSLTVQGLKDILYNSANLEDWGPAGHDVDYGRGMLLAYNAIRQAAGGSGSFDDAISHSYVSGSLPGTGANHQWSFNVTDTSKPVAISMVMSNYTCYYYFWCYPDFDLYLLSPSGATVASAEGTARQETIRFQPTETGTYTVRVYSYASNGSFFFDASYR